MSPSYSEGGGPLTALATPVGILPDVCTREHLLFVDIGDYARLAERIVSQLQSPERRWEIGMAGHNLVTEEFNLKVYADRLQELYQFA